MTTTNMKIRMIIGLCVVAFATGNAQTLKPGSYLHFNVGAGAHDLSYDLLNGTNTVGKPGLTINGAYSYFFSKHWGLQTGIGAQTISGLSTLNYMSSTPSVDESGSFDLRTYYTNWKEKQQTILADVPMLLQFRAKVGEKLGLIASVGGKMALPVYTKYASVGNGSIETRGYFPQVNGELSNVPEHGFMKITTVPEGKFSFNPSVMGVADLGGLIRLTEKTDLYIGGYLNYGLNNILKPDVKEVYQAGLYNGVFASNQVSEVIPVTLGVKVGFYFSTRKKDTDGDGVSDRKDKCPDTPVEAYGKINEYGCPLDTDGDGVPDYLDKCPDTPVEAYGKIDASGCPLDTDGDGVPDYLDKCPDTPVEAYGKIDSSGCPLDTDGDGVPDYLDKCPGTPKEAYGKIDANGCPLDTDGDGVPDYLDKCPNTPKEAYGKIDANGCPLDTDGDGVLDYLDKCPTVPGLATNKGCPEVKKEVKTLFKKALQGIQFENNKYVIRPISFKLLNDIAKVLIDNPSYLIEIQGHTDDVGSEESNLVLSDRRANAVRTYLVAKGVDANRLISHGYGEAVPVADNKTAKGRAQNRRVEFIVSFEITEFK